MISILIFSLIIIGGYDCHQIALTPDKTDFHINETATLTCPVPSNAGDDRAVTWFHNGDSITNSILTGSRKERMKADGHELEILKMTRWDSGLYRCCWSFESLRDGCADVSLRVYTPPTYISGTPRFGAYADERVEFGHEFEGYPEPTVYWRRENDEPFFNGSLVYNGTDVVIPKMSEMDEGLYYCFAENGVGAPKKVTTRLRLYERKVSRRDVTGGKTLI